MATRMEPPSVSEHSIIVSLHKAKQDKEDESALLDDKCEHDTTMKKVLKNRDDILIDKQDSLIYNDIVDSTRQAQMREMGEHEREEAIQRDMHKHEERMKRVAQYQKNLADKRHADVDRLIYTAEDYKKKAPIRHAAAVPE